MTDEAEVAIVGGGVIGTCIAYYLAREGVSVLLLEQGEVGSGCSEGNAGQITPGHLPLPQPGTMWRNLRWLVRPDSPLYIHPAHLMRHVGWFSMFARSCTPRHLQRATRVLCDLGRLSFKLFEELARERDFGFKVQGRVEVAADEDTFGGLLEEAALLRRFGFAYETWDETDVRRRVPELRGPVHGAVYYPESAHCDPACFVRCVAELAEEEGAELRTGVRVLELEFDGHRVRTVVTSQGEVEADHVVLATGAWTPYLLRRLGYPVPILPGKGYHVDYRHGPGLPARPVVLVRERVFVTPLEGRCRFAGTMEFSGFNRRLRSDRLALLEAAASANFDLSQSQKVDVWCHLRPMSSDGLPYIGPVGWLENLWIAAGHGMLGLTQAPATGWILAQWIVYGEVRASVDLAALRPDRHATQTALAGG